MPPTGKIGQFFIQVSTSLYKFIQVYTSLYKFYTVFYYNILIDEAHVIARVISNLCYIFKHATRVIRFIWPFQSFIYFDLMVLQVFLSKTKLKLFMVQTVV